MSNNLVPKVTITEAAESLSVPQNNQVIIGIIGTSESGTANVIQRIGSVSEAETLFGSNTANWATLLSMIKRAFQEWASTIKAISVWTPTAGTPETLTWDTLAWALVLTVADAASFATDDVVYVWTGETYAKEEKRVVTATTATTITVDRAFTFAHTIWEKVTSVTEKISTAFATAITAMAEDEGKSIVVCELNDTATANLLETMCATSSNDYNTPCVYIRWPEVTMTASEAVTAAQTHNDKRVIMVFPALTDFNWKIVTPWETAAAIAWAIAWNWIPKLNHNYTDLSGFGWVATKIANFDTLIAGWVTPIQLKYNSIHIVRFLTTYTSNAWISDSTWSEAAVRMNIDYIQNTIAMKMHRDFMQKGNTPETRNAIKVTIENILANFATAGILVADENTGTPAYKTPVVSVDTADNTAVNVDMEVSPGKPLNFIRLNFKVFI